MMPGGACCRGILLRIEVGAAVTQGPHTGFGVSGRLIESSRRVCFTSNAGTSIPNGIFLYGPKRSGGWVRTVQPRPSMTEPVMSGRMAIQSGASDLFPGVASESATRVILVILVAPPIRKWRCCPVAKVGAVVLRHDSPTPTVNWRGHSSSCRRSDGARPAPPGMIRPDVAYWTAGCPGDADCLRDDPAVASRAAALAGNPIGACAYRNSDAPSGAGQHRRAAHDSGCPSNFRK
jgi:hypothetical protein